MAVKRVTREDLKNLKRKRKKKIYAMTAFVLAVLIVLCVGLPLFLHKIHEKNGKKDKYHAVMPTDGVAANLGEADENMQPAVDFAALQQIQAQNEMVSDMEFTVPETSLPAVEEITGDNWYDENLYEKASTEPTDLSYFSNTVFIGDSRTEGLLLYSGLPNLNGFCYKGLSVDKLSTDKNIVVPGKEEKFTCYEAIDTVKYHNYYCMFGVNELGWVSVDVFIQDFNDLLDHIRAANADAVIYVESVLPVTEKLSTENDIYKQDRINEYNEKLLEMCKQRGDVIYLDIAAAVTDEKGYLPEEASTDGIHCNSDYCKRVIQYIRCNTFLKK